MTSDRPHHDRDDFANDPLARIARNAHAASLDRLSPRVQAQLALRRRAARDHTDTRQSVRLWPMLALGSAAALTLAVGLFVLRGHEDTGTPPTPDAVVTAPTPVIDTGPPASTATAGRDTTPRTAPAVASATDAGNTAIDRAPVESAAIEDDVPPAELLAAEFDTADEAMGLGAQEESPDFYLWLGSQDAQADVTESL